MGFRSKFCTLATVGTGHVYLNQGYGIVRLTLIYYQVPKNWECPVILRPCLENTFLSLISIARLSQATMQLQPLQYSLPRIILMNFFENVVA